MLDTTKKKRKWREEKVPVHADSHKRSKIEHTHPGNHVININSGEFCYFVSVKVQARARGIEGGIEGERERKKPNAKKKKKKSIDVSAPEYIRDKNIQFYEIKSKAAFYSST